MIEKLLANEIYVILIAIPVFVLPFLICCFHFKKYGILQAIFSLITIPVLFCGLGDFLCFIFKTNETMLTFFQGIFYGLDNATQLFRKLFSFTGWEWLYDTGWFYLPFGLLFVLTYGYSITFHKRKKLNQQ